ncbi:TPA: hypothetical protein SLU74_006309 [Pseudomonas aeruginosa]|uniref:hypothetical protein n=1 Tax=Pseudomonas TaxID=286 RepID=UPI0003BAD3AD|nr:hypothetical protein [Pseudomonas aeruginosa]WQZ01474.1 hypothetical protein [Pseudomonas phage PfAC02b]HDK9341723.1 hypothetical protein [Staphylococcus aureus]EJA2566538.1 hypothetical protein [Pseudomonas aeruginosa]ELY1690077.1 hypothetical protein [Pseudomonas aeruginosa]ERX78389.1 hypothetical protein P997_01952 [Pseudomonas aeruginosa 62]
MKADWDDAPQHLKRKRQSAGKWVAAVTAGVAFTALAVYVTDQKLTFPPEPPIAQAPPAESYTPKYAFNEPAGQPATSTEQLFWDDVNERNRQQAQPKQTVYNDTNYVPKGATNIVDMEAVRQSEAYRNSTAASGISSRNSIEQSGAWVDKWSGGARYYAEWTVFNNYIDDTSVCANHNRGSISYRECRKGAKQFFKEECRSWKEKLQDDRKSFSYLIRQRYCSAASSFNPMG